METLMSKGNWVVGPLPGCDKTVALTRQQMEEGKRRLVARAVTWLEFPEEARAYWIGTKTDLLEIVRYVWELQAVRTTEGVPASFRWLVLVFFTRLNVEIDLRSCYALTQKATSRKGLYMPTMLWRYCWRMFLAHNPDPLANLVVLLPPKEKGEEKKQ